jgi:hypothetical protein
MRSVIGWDVGGTHLKAARADDGRITEAMQVAAPLRLGLERLAQAFAEVKARIGAAHLHAVTMTGELADTFSSRAEGVGKLAALAVRVLAPTEVLLYAGRAGFIAPQDAPRHVEDIVGQLVRQRRARGQCARAYRGLGSHHRWCGSGPPSPRAATPMPSALPPASSSIPAWCAAS